MQIEFEIPNIKPLLSNHATKITTRGRYPSEYKTDEAKDFERQALLYLKTIEHKFIKIKNFYDINKHYLIVDFRFYVPLFTKKGLISKKSGDYDGYIKYSQDVVFDFLGIDDSQIISGTSTKIHSENYNIAVNISIQPLINIK